MSKPEIGQMACPCCGEAASVREQKNGRSYLLCNSAVCGFQGFTRSADADRHLRAKMKPHQEQPPAPAAANEPPKKKGFFDDLASL